MHRPAPMSSIAMFPDTNRPEWSARLPWNRPATSRDQIGLAPGGQLVVVAKAFSVPPARCHTRRQGGMI